MHAFKHKLIGLVFAATGHNWSELILSEIHFRSLYEALAEFLILDRSEETRAYKKRSLAGGMAGLLRFNSLAPKTKNLIVAGGLTGFVFGVYFYTMRAVGGTDELQVAIDKFEAQKGKNEGETSLASKA
ncbi:hypothetical protein RJ640_014247 [Escallonia rubra]|uniref:Cytochrome c oxidase assembly factor 3 mitochondrial coiled-coil domain-containing protein n=1 Tax=Escallonia rubra TaxID=112253 RepID=A0AA88QIG4_9ASTE|nr:hypothetical protein RJ640_014247 [Escallonia rubra]